MASNLIVVDFRLFPDSHVLPVSFTLAGHQFDSIDPAANPMVNDTAGDRGLQFSNRGLSIRLSNVVDGLVLAGGGFASAVTVRAKSSSGTELWSQELRPKNQFVRVSVKATGIAELELADGGGEGMLLEIITPC